VSESRRMQSPTCNQRRGRDDARVPASGFPFNDFMTSVSAFMHTSDSSAGTDGWMKSRRCKNLSACLEREPRLIRGRTSSLARGILGESRTLGIDAEFLSGLRVPGESQ
jgi:hypothetical protein